MKTDETGIIRMLTSLSCAHNLFVWMRDDPVHLFQKQDAEIANLKSHPPEPKSDGETEKQLEYATISKNPPKIAVEYAGIDSSSEQKAEKQLTVTNEYCTFN